MINDSACRQLLISHYRIPEMNPHVAKLSAQACFCFFKGGSDDLPRQLKASGAQEERWPCPRKLFLSPFFGPLFGGVIRQPCLGAQYSCDMQGVNQRCCTNHFRTESVFSASGAQRLRKLCVPCNDAGQPNGFLGPQVPNGGLIKASTSTETSA